MRKDPEGQRTLFQIADQEKVHLNSLGDLLEQKI
jgi:rubrerythrin